MNRRSFLTTPAVLGASALAATETGPQAPAVTRPRATSRIAVISSPVRVCFWDSDSCGGLESFGGRAILSPLFLLRGNAVVITHSLQKRGGRGDNRTFGTYQGDSLIERHTAFI